MTKRSSIHLFLLSLFLLLLNNNCSNNQNQQKSPEVPDTVSITGELMVFHAGSLSVPFREIAAYFEKENPNVKVYLEAAGSVACARKITDLGRKCDVFGSADYNVIDQLLIPEYAKWNIKFVSNEMTIVFTGESKYRDEINSKNWIDILLKDDVFYGRSNPDSDPCGYRTVLSLKLAEKYYDLQGITEKFLTKDQEFIRPKEVDLIALLETNTIDYIFLYRSVAEQHHLNYILLPDEVNLKNPELSDLYSTVSVDISGKNPGEYITQKGEPMIYGITIPVNAPNKLAAEAFVEFVLDKDKGMKILENNGQPSLIPAETNAYENIPGRLKKFAKKNH